MNKVLGHAAVTFGSPHNNSTETTIDAINKCGKEICNLLFAVDPKRLSGRHQLLLRCNYEGKPGKVNYDEFIKNYNRIKDYPYFVMQGHPAMWNTTDVKEHNKIIDFLIKEGNTFVTPSRCLRKNYNKSYEIDNKEYIEKLEDIIDTEKKVYIYGCGEIGREMIKYLSMKCFDINGFVVSDDQTILNKNVSGNPVYHLSDICKENRDMVIILALLGDNHKTIYPALNQYNIKYWPNHKTDKYDKFIDYIRYYISEKEY
jgi:hypothetical protein